MFSDRQHSDSHRGEDGALFSDRQHSVSQRGEDGQCFQTGSTQAVTEVRMGQCFQTGSTQSVREVRTGSVFRQAALRQSQRCLPKGPSHPGCHITLSRVLHAIHRSLLPIYFKYSSVYMAVPNSLSPPAIPDGKNF